MLTGTLVVVVVLMVALWLVSLRLRDASIVDIFWGPGFMVIAWASLLLSPTPSPRAWLVRLLVTAWGLRLGIHLALRNLGHGEDYRYRAMRERYGRAFPVVSLGLVFLLQAALMWIVSAPVQAVHAAAAGPLTLIDGIGVILWVTGFTCELVADAQLAAFRRAHAGRGLVMDRGLWRYSRHPNYFGDALAWWGIGVIALAGGAWWALVGPLVMTVLLLKVSGVSLLESTITERRPGYREYMARTSAFVPWPPRRSH